MLKARIMKPLLIKLHAAINAVAKEKGYTYVLDSSQTSLLYRHRLMI